MTARPAFRSAAVALAAMTLVPRLSPAQAPEPGSRVRVLFAPGAGGSAGRSAIGRLVARDAQALVLDRGDRIDTIPEASIRRVDVRTTRSLGSSVLHGTALGAAVGGGLGLLAGAALHDGYSCSDGGFCVDAGAGAVTGLVVGAVLGSVVGLMSGSGERWQRGSTRAKVTVMPGRPGGVLVGMSIPARM